MPIHPDTFVIVDTKLGVKPYTLGKDPLDLPENQPTDEEVTAFEDSIKSFLPTKEDDGKAVPASS